MLFNSENLSIFFPLKNYIANHPIRFMSLSLILSVIFFSSVIIVLERPVSASTDKNLDEWGEVIWFVVVTMATIGYGDRTIKTRGSRITVMFLVIWGNFWSSIFLSSMIPYLQLSQAEKKSYNRYNRLALRKRIAARSQELIALVTKLRYKIDYKSLSDSKAQSMVRKAAYLMREIRQLKKALTNIISETHFFVDDILMNVEKADDMTHNELVKAEKVYQNVEQTLNYLSKSIRGSIRKMDKHSERNTVTIDLLRAKLSKKIKKSGLDSSSMHNSVESDSNPHLYNFEKLGEMNEESLKDYKKMYKDIKKNIPAENNLGMDFSEDLHKYLSDYLEVYQNEPDSKIK